MALSPTSIYSEGLGVVQVTSTVAGVWTTDVGNLFYNLACTIPYNGAAALSVYLRVVNVTTSGTIHCGVASAVVGIMGVLPDFPHYPMEWDGKVNGIVVSIARSGRVRGRVLGDQSYIRDYKLVYNNRTPSAVVDFENFHAAHYPDKIFKYYNRWHNISGYYRFDSDLKGKAEGKVRGNLDIAIAQVPYTAPTPPSDISGS